MQSRQAKILSLVSKKIKVSVAELSEALKVSDVTVRKDLSQLEQSGLLRREHGFAAMVTTDDVSKRLSFNYEIKRNIARKALESVKDGETVMIESGSCCALLAEEIAQNRQGATIITNSVFIATFLRNKFGSRIILLGGEYQHDSQVMVGPLVKQGAENFHVEKFFIGTDGFNERGAMSGDMMRAAAVRDMAENSLYPIILTESKKFSQMGVVPFLPFEKIHSIYTDSEIDISTLQNLENQNIKVCTTDKEEIK